MAKDMKIVYLLDFYGAMLTEKQRDVLDLYYNEDLSLAEIGQNTGITRQGVRDSIKRGEFSLLEMEEKLGLYRRMCDINDTFQSIRENIEIIRIENSGYLRSSILEEAAQKILTDIKERLD